MSADEAAAVVAHLDAVTDLAGGAHDATPPAATYPYVVVYMGSGPGYGDREAFEQFRRSINFQTTVVGGSVAQARAALDRVVDALEDWVPTVDGRTCTRVQHIPPGRPLQPDESLPDRVVYYATDDWSFVSDPA